jgi:2-hydroxycyclohexanecarboxyl-CoA dehydrogenase
MSDVAKNQVAIVTGGTAGIGLACAATLIFQGFTRLTVVGRSEARGMAAREFLRKKYPNADVRFVAADVSTPAGANSAVEAFAATFGRIDALISVAGGAPIPRLLHEIPIEDVGRIIGSISSGVLLPVRAVLPIMMEKKAGSIICIASDAAKVAILVEVAIGAAMAAIAMFCRALAIETKRSGIRVNCVTPSVVKDTPFYSTLMADPYASKLFSKAERLALLGVVEQGILHPSSHFSLVRARPG